MKALLGVSAMMVVLSFCAGVTTNAHGAIRWRPCKGAKHADCAVIRAPLDYAGRFGGSVRFRAMRKIVDPGRPWLVYIPGGPGPFPPEEFFSKAVQEGRRPIFKRFNLLVYEHRATSPADELSCDAVPSGSALMSGRAKDVPFSPKKINQCGHQLSNKRSFYTSYDEASDVELLRQEAGLDRFVMAAESYGTRVALHYLRTYPQRVSRLVLDSVLDIDSTDPFARDTSTALRDSLAAMCAVDKCGLPRDPLTALSELIGQLDSQPLRARGPNVEGKLVTRKLTSRLVFATFASIQTGLAPLSGLEPAAIYAARVNKDAAPLLRLAEAIGATRLDEITPPPRVLASWCEELPFPWSRDAPLRQRPALLQQGLANQDASAFSPFDSRAVMGQRISTSWTVHCRAWPRSLRHGSLETMSPYPAVPTLIVQGGDDIQTPKAHAVAVAAKIPGAKRIIVPNVGHVQGLDPTTVSSTFAGQGVHCAIQALDKFLKGEQFGTDCQGTGGPFTFSGGRATARPNMPRVLALATTVSPRNTKTLPRVIGVPKRTGETIAAVVSTLQELRVFRTALFGPSLKGDFHLPGVRDGVATFKRSHLSLDDYSLVPGVRLSGRGDLSPIGLKIKKRRRGRAEIQVAGKSAVSGRIVVDERVRHLRGRLNGQHVYCHVSARISCTLGPSA